jgi:predicted helicase
MEIVNTMAEQLGLTFVAEKPTTQNPQPTTSFAPIDILDYIYAVLHSPTYREKYKEFLKIDFPRVPYPKDQKTFFDLVDLGSQLREIHLLESEVTENYSTKYPIDGDNVVTKPHFVISTQEKRKFSEAKSHNENFSKCDASLRQHDKAGRVYINSIQFFNDVPEVAWNFYIGGYQPAQKWLKDRKGRTLSFEDIFHYQKIIVALTETDRIMREIDTIEL